ncbi:MAG TPA: YbhB/YbcL family Raf kinase inhibitor-like protein [Casimicrobiaceae bacterium]|nr:YbhB/YbcL family Raf kinase inhibitor-like protein [Casimicrobiaceae bacterium]
MIDIVRNLHAWLHPVLGAAPAGPQALRFKLHSPDIKAEATVPPANVYQGCGGQNVSPALEWHNPPSGTRSFAITMYDPDAPTGSGWWHWMAFDIPASATGLARGAGNPTGTRPAGMIQARNDYGEVGYGGPCPPPGDRPHRYIFTVFALKVGRLDVKSDSSCALIGFNLNANKIEDASFMSYYGR